MFYQTKIKSFLTKLPGRGKSCRTSIINELHFLRVLPHEIENLLLHHSQFRIVYLDTENFLTIGSIHGIHVVINELLKTDIQFFWVEIPQIRIFRDKFRDM